MRSFLFVIPITRMLLRDSTPSILVSSWFTTKSGAFEPLLFEPLCLQIASISSNTMIWSGLWSPNDCSSSRAFLNNLRMFYSDSPTYLLKISGPLTIVSYLALRTLASCLAISVFPVPGGPKSNIPLMCFIPNFSTIACGNLLEAKALLKMFVSSSSSPPIPISAIWKSALNRFWDPDWSFFSLILSPTLILYLT